MIDCTVNNSEGSVFTTPKYDCSIHGEIDCVINFTVERKGWGELRRYCGLCFEDQLIERGALVKEKEEG